MPRKPRKREPSVITERIREARARMRREGIPNSLRDISNSMGELGFPASPSYLSLIENGLSIPSEEVADGLAQVLGEDRKLFRSWATCKGDLAKYDEAATVLRRRIAEPLLRDPGVTKVGLVVKETRFIPEAEWLVASMTLSASAAIPRFAMQASPSASPIPVYHSLSDWDGDRQPVGRLELSPRYIQMIGLSEESFAFPVTESIARRVRSRGMGNGLLAILTARSLELEMGEVYVVRQPKGLALSHVWWDRKVLVLLPDHEDDDFVRIEVTEQRLRDHVIGKIALLELGAVEGLVKALESRPKHR